MKTGKKLYLNLGGKASGRKGEETRRENRSPERRAGRTFSGIWRGEQPPGAGPPFHWNGVWTKDK